MYRPFSALFVLSALAAAPAFAGPILVTLDGNFGPWYHGVPRPPVHSTLDNQDFLMTFLIPDPSSPSATTCLSCGEGVSAIYNVIAHLEVPQSGLSLDSTIAVEYHHIIENGLRKQFLHIPSFTGLPWDDYLTAYLVPYPGITLWNGLSGELGAPELALLNAARTDYAYWDWMIRGRFGPFPDAEYQASVTITQEAVPEPATAWLLAAAIPLLALAWRKRRTR